MKQIPLSQGKFALVDDADFELASKYKFSAVKRGNSFYAERRQRIGLRGEDNGRSMKLHRLIMGVSDPKILVDHIDKDGLNCQRSNMRLCSKAENNRNRRSAENSSSKYLGVSFHAHSGRWQASMTHNGKTVYIGLYGTEREAALAYNKKAERLNGEFASFNIL